MAALEDGGCLGSRLAPAYTSISISTKEPWVMLDVAGKKINFLVDTEATYSVFNFHAVFLASKLSNIMGVEENSRTHPLSLVS